MECASKMRGAWRCGNSPSLWMARIARRVANLFANDSDGDGINDGFEQFYFGTLANGAASDTDGDGIGLLAEFTGGTNPLYGNVHQDGGVAWADSSLVVVNLQPYERLSKMLVNSTLTNFFSADPGVVTGIQAGTWSATAMTDWDGDGDLDLFVAHEGGLRVFRNIGTAQNPNFEEITSGFRGIGGVRGIHRPAESSRAAIGMATASAIW